MDPLSQAEKDRASRCRFEKDQARFISGPRHAAPVARRATPASRPEKIAFRYEAQGKPMLADGAGLAIQSLPFAGPGAVSPSRRDQPVGIDLEQIDPEFPCRRSGGGYLFPRRNCTN